MVSPFPKAKARCRGVRAMGRGLVRAGADAVLFFTNDRIALTLAIGGAAKPSRSALVWRESPLIW